MAAKPPKPKLIVLSGPTGVGKTKLGLLLAARFNGRIINADAMQVYRYMDIGTAKPTAEQQAAAAHELIDVVDPDQAYDAARYLKDARAVVDDCRRRGATPLAVGGTGLYLRSLLMGLFDGPPQDEGFRNQLQKEARRLGRRRLHQRLDQVDPKAAARIHENDLVRIIRALEVHHLTGRPISEYQADHSLADRPFDVLFFCLTRPRDELNRRIERRTQAMIEAGWAAEVEGLLNRGYHRDLKPMKAIGYRELVRYVQGDWPLPRARDEIIKRTRQYAKRQMTWHRSQEGVIMVDVNQTDRVIDRAEAFIESNPEAA